MDAEATLRSVPSLGFDGVELVGDFGWSVEKWRALLVETGLSVVAGHTSLEALEGDLTTLLGFHRALGASRLVVTALPRAPQTAERYHEGAQRLNAAGERLAKEGFMLAYHHHDFEFQWTSGPEGPCGLDVLLAETDSTLVGFEFDTFWLETAGHRTVDFIRRHAARTRLIHAKDWRAGGGKDVPVGAGSIDFGALLPMCAAGDWPLILEYEGVDAVESVRQGASHLRSLMG